MTGYRQRERIAVPEGWEKQFGLPSPRGKVRCLICGASGWPSSERPFGWQLPHIAGHPEKCDRCEAPFIKGGMGKHRRACTGTPIGQYAHLLQLRASDS